MFDTSIPSLNNELGVKGVGELGTIGAVPAVAIWVPFNVPIKLNTQKVLPSANGICPLLPMQRRALVALLMHLN